MPYKCFKQDDKWIVKKHNEDGSWEALKSSGHHASLVECNKQVRALYSQESVKNEADISLQGEVGWDFSSNFIDYQLFNITKDTVKVNISSRGGDYITALEIYNKLRECGKHIITSIQGLAVSAGAVIALAGDEIEAASNSVIMFHMPEYTSREPLTAEEMQKKVEMMHKFESSLVNIVQNRTGWDEDKSRKFLKSQEYLTPEEAEDMKLIDRILPFARKKVDVTNLDVPERIVAFVSDKNKEIDDMTTVEALKGICSKVELKIEDSATEEQIIAKLVEEVTNLRTELAKKPVVSTVQRMKLPETIINMVKRTRETEVNALVNEGKITAAVSSSLVSIFGTDEVISNATDEKGEIRDNFDKVIDALRKNEKVINYGGQTGVQGTGALPRGQQEVNPLIEDAERRAKAAHQSRGSF